MPHAYEVALLSCALLGFRHGFDYDHLAAISDITSLQRGVGEGMRLGLLYALGHAFTVAALGAAVIFLHIPLPAHLDALGERLVGATLVALAVYVLLAGLRSRRHGHTHVSRSRLALLISGARYAAWRARRVLQPGLPQPAPFAFHYDRSSVFLVGVIHGLGAETPSQLLLFLLAAHLGGTSRGFLGLACFIGGLLLMDTVMTATASGIFAGSRARPVVQTVITSLTAVYSLIVGLVFLLGASNRLPVLQH